MELEQGQAQAAPTPEPTTAPATFPEGSTPGDGAVETTPTSTSQSMEDADAEFSAFYDPPAPEASEGGEETREPEEPVPNGVAEAEQPKQAQAAPELPEQLRPRLSDPEDIAIASLAKSRGIKLSEAAAIIAPSRPSDIPGAESVPSEPTATQQLESEIAELIADLKADRQDDDYLSPVHLDKMDRLADLRGDLRMQRFQQAQADQDAQAREQQASANAQAREQQASANARIQSIEAAKARYPDAAKGNTLLGANVTAVLKEWQANPARESFLQAADAPQMIAAEAATRTAADLFRNGKFATVDLALASLAAKTGPTPLSPPAPPATPPPRRVTPAPGSKGQSGGDQPSTFGEAVASANTSEDVDALFKARYGPKAYSLGS